MSEIKLYKSPLSVFYLFITCFIFVVIGILMVYSDNSFEGWLVLLSFGFGSLVSLVLFFDKKPQIIINQKGIWRRKAIWTKYDSSAIIEWSSIKGVYIQSVESNKFLCLIPVQIEDKKQNTIQKKFRRLNKEMGFQDLNINLGLMKIDEHKLADFINSIVVSNDSQRENLIKNFIIPIPKSFFSKK